MSEIRIFICLQILLSVADPASFSLGSFFQIIQGLHYKKRFFSKSYIVYTTKKTFFSKSTGFLGTRKKALNPPLLTIRILSVAYKLSKSRTTNESYTKAINSDSKQSALQIMKDEQPRYFLFNFQKLDAQLDTVFQQKHAPWVSPYAVSSFTNVPQVMQKWADDYCSSDSASRPLIKPQSIIIEGDSRTGKTMWARSLGRHNYLSGYLDLNPTVFSNDVEYNVIDNVNPQCLKHWKELLGAERDWQAKCKYRKPVQIKGGVPAIVLCNPGVGSSYMEYLNKSRNEGLKSWTLQHVTFIVLQEPLFST
ncbi:putative geminivirus AL1 replication-associated protein, CLV type [Helianthus debilis subsp. tardiflorus]